MISQLYDIDVRTVNLHLKSISQNSVPLADTAIRYFRITTAVGEAYDTKHYNVTGITAVGYRVNSESAVQCRKWAFRFIEEYIIKVFAIDDESLQSGGSAISDRYFEEELQGIQEIRMSEVKFYNKNHLHLRNFNRLRPYSLGNQARHLEEKGRAKALGPDKKGRKR